MQRSSNSDVAAWFISRKVLGIRGKKGECESPTDDMVRISCSHLLGSLVICRITKYQPDKPPPDWSSLWLGHLSFLLFRSNEPNQCSEYQPSARSCFIHFELVNDLEKTVSKSASSKWGLGMIRSVGLR